MESHQTTDPTGYAPAGPFEHEPPGGYAQPEVRQRAFAAALAGVPAGAYDRVIVNWLVGWDDPTCRTIVSLLWRARQAGSAALAAEVAAVADGIRAALGDEEADWQAIGDDSAERLRQIAAGRVPGLVTLTAGQAATALQALADAAAARRAGGWCRDCVTGVCSDHGADAGRAEAYEALSRELGGHQDEDESEPYCTVCGAPCGIFRGHGDGWHHYRGDGTAEHPVELYDAGHVPAVAWRPVGDDR